MAVSALLGGEAAAGGTRPRGTLRREAGGPGQPPPGGRDQGSHASVQRPCHPQPPRGHPQCFPPADTGSAGDPQPVHRAAGPSPVCSAHALPGHPGGWGVPARSCPHLPGWSPCAAGGASCPPGASTTQHPARSSRPRAPCLQVCCCGPRGAALCTPPSAPRNQPCAGLRHPSHNLALGPSPPVWGVLGDGPAAWGGPGKGQGMTTRVLCSGPGAACGSGWRRPEPPVRIMPAPGKRQSQGLPSCAPAAPGRAWPPAPPGHPAWSSLAPARSQALALPPGIPILGCVPGASGCAPPKAGLRHPSGQGRPPEGLCAQDPHPRSPGPLGVPRGLDNCPAITAPDTVRPEPGSTGPGSRPPPKRPPGRLAHGPLQSARGRGERAGSARARASLPGSGASPV